MVPIGNAWIVMKPGFASHPIGDTLWMGTPTRQAAVVAA